MGPREAGVAAVDPRPHAAQRHRVAELPPLQPEERVAAAEGAVEHHAFHRQPVAVDLREEGRDDLVRAQSGGVDQAHGVAPAPVQQDGRGVVEEVMGALFFGAAGDAGGGPVAVVGDRVGVDGDRPAAAAVEPGEGEDAVPGGREPGGQLGGGGQLRMDGAAAGLGAEGEAAADGGGEGPGGAGHVHEPVDDLNPGDGRLVIGPVEDAGERAVHLGVDRRRRDARMGGAHGEHSLFNVVVHMNLEFPMGLRIRCSKYW